jgi:hypothetical protein
MFLKSSNSTSMVALTGPEASVAGVWQWIQPWVWTMLVMPGAGAAHRELEAAAGELAALEVLDQRVDLGFSRPP